MPRFAQRYPAAGATVTRLAVGACLVLSLLLSCMLYLDEHQLFVSSRVPRFRWALGGGRSVTLSFESTQPEGVQAAGVAAAGGTESFEALATGAAGPVLQLEGPVAESVEQPEVVADVEEPAPDAAEHSAADSMKGTQTLWEHGQQQAAQQEELQQAESEQQQEKQHTEPRQQADEQQVEPQQKEEQQQVEPQQQQAEPQKQQAEEQQQQAEPQQQPGQHAESGRQQHIKPEQIEEQQQAGPEQHDAQHAEAGQPEQQQADPSYEGQQHQTTTQQPAQEQDLEGNLAGEALGLPCAVSGYCSLGRVKAWVGDVATNAALKEMLEAVAYRNEVIFTLTDMGFSFQRELSLNVVRRAKALGYDHYFLLTGNQSQCDAIPTPFRGKVSCVWDSSTSPIQFPEYAMLERRWSLVARILRMGYNAFSVDTDTVLTTDVYTYLKSPPLNKYNALFQEEGSLGQVNCGVMYWQNAHPSGPVTWMTTEHAYRIYRMHEDSVGMRSVFLTMKSGEEWTLRAATWEQTFWNDMISSVADGYPVSLQMSEFMPQALQAENKRHSFGKRLRQEQIEWPKGWQLVSGEVKGRLLTVDNLTLPLVSDSWWQARSKYFYPPQQGNASAALMQLFKEASELPFYELGKPWEGKPDISTENFAFLPHWFAHTYAGRGQHGFWALDPPAQVVPHDVYLPYHFSDWKQYTFKGFGWWRWEVTEAFTGKNVLGWPDPKLLMLAPAVQLHTKTEDEFKYEIGKLARLAEMLGRRLVVPNPPCDSVWLGVFLNKEEQKETFLQLWPEYYDGGQVLQFWDTQRPGNRTYCHWTRALERGCRDVTAPHVDALAYLERLHQPEQTDPKASNMLWHDKWLAAGGAEGPGKDSPPPEPVLLAGTEQWVQLAAGYKGAPVLYLGALPKLASNDTLPPLPAEFDRCYLFDSKHWLQHLEGFPQGQENRQKSLNGTLQR